MDGTNGIYVEGNCKICGETQSSEIMNTDQFILNLIKRESIQVEIGLPSSNDQIKEIENKLGVIFPKQVRWFYLACNGLKTKEPALKIRPLSELIVDHHNSNIEFALFDNQHRLSFDLSYTNEAGQWNIINSKTKF